MEHHDDIALLSHYFPELDAKQLEAFDKLGELYPEWNAKINVISRKDIDSLYQRHILHSLAIAKFLGPLKPGTTFLDLGTGGGFPGIPMAIFYPDCKFLLLDRIAKKLRVASKIASAIGLKNIEIQHGDAGECHRKFDYVVSRAVMPLDGLVKIASRNIDRNGKAGSFPSGLVCLKGGDLDEEIKVCGRKNVVRVPVSDYFKEEFFQTKDVIYLPL